MAKRAYAALARMLLLLATSFVQGSTPQCEDAKSSMECVASQIRVFHIWHGEYPESLDAMCEAMRCWCSFGDLWGFPFVYVRLPSGYELYSSGRDGVANTEDDMFPYVPWVECTVLAVFYGDEKAWREPTDPCSVAEEVLWAWQFEIHHYHRRYGKYPEALTRQDDGFRGFWDWIPYRYVVNVELDPWGQRYVYGISASGYVLFSSGPDGVPNTDDDVFPGDRPDKCRLLLLEGHTGIHSAPGEAPLQGIQSESLPVTCKPMSGCGCSVCEY